jgi:AcrR family transcriptional regulator
VVARWRSKIPRAQQTWTINRRPARVRILARNAVARRSGPSSTLLRSNGERGFHETSISGITRRAGVALGSFYTYFDSKDAVFRALVRDMSDQVRDRVAPAIRSAPDQIAAERAGLLEFISFVRTHKEIYRIIDEAEFVDPPSFKLHYATTAERIAARLRTGAERGEIIANVSEVHAWAIMGMNVFLGLRYGVWGQDRTPESVADTVAEMLAKGLSPGA